MEVFTISYTKKSAEVFFGLLETNKIDVLIDVRLYNSTQLAGFSKSRDLQFFLERLCGCGYVWAKRFAPSSALFNAYKNGQIDWSGYEGAYNELLDTRGGLEYFQVYVNRRICLLCAEETPEHCHRRLLAEKIAAVYGGVTITHF
ncbi:MAG: DUF488 domain-containing protein [Oscillospiraceae bacterium]|jgi:uncharacterized protein (DUF488 family)|nr:DUF488 domain-containing protein [Oscillospiraceae bacterium]